MRILIKFQLLILKVRIFFIQNDIENGFGTLRKEQKLRQFKLIKNILQLILKQ